MGERGGFLRAKARARPEKRDFAHQLQHGRKLLPERADLGQGGIVPIDRETRLRVAGREQRRDGRVGVPQGRRESGLPVVAGGRGLAFRLDSPLVTGARAAGVKRPARLQCLAEQNRPVRNIIIPFDQGGARAGAVDHMAIERPDLVADVSAMIVDQECAMGVAGLGMSGEMDFADPLQRKGVEIVFGVKAVVGRR